MDIIGAAALIAAGIVVAAVLYARVNPGSPGASGHARGRPDGGREREAASRDVQPGQSRRGRLLG